MSRLASDHMARCQRPLSQRLAVAGGGLVLAVGALAGCSAGESPTPAATTDEVTNATDEQLVVYSGRSESLVGEVFDRFSEQTGVDVAVRYGETPELAAQLLEEGDRTPAEVFLSQDAGALEAVADEGLTTQLPQRTLAKVDPIYRSEAGQWVGTSGRARVLLYNKEAVPADQVPTGVRQLTDPKWRSQVGIAPTNASFQSFVTAMRITEGETATKQWLDDMIANDVQRFENNIAIRDAVDAGQIKLGLANHYYWYEKADEVGAQNLKVANEFLAAGDPGSLVNVAGAAIVRGADESQRDPNAQKLVDFLLSDDAQEYFSNVTKEYPLVKGVERQEGLPPLNELKGPDITLGQLSDLAATQQLLQQVGLL